jgi:putative oxidoreductase
LIAPEEKNMIDAATAPWAATILRLGLGTLFLAHGLLKLLVFKPAGTYSYFKSLGLPGALAYVTITAELVGGAALIVGFMPRYVALALIPLILGTIVTVHGKNGWMFSNKDGGWEFPAFWALALFVQFLLGDGAWVLIASPRWF